VVFVCLFISSLVLSSWSSSFKSSSASSLLFVVNRFVNQRFVLANYRLSFGPLTASARGSREIGLLPRPSPPDSQLFVIRYSRNILKGLLELHNRLQTLFCPVIRKLNHTSVEFDTKSTLLIIAQINCTNLFQLHILGRTACCALKSAAYSVAGDMRFDN